MLKKFLVSVCIGLAVFTGGLFSDINPTPVAQAYSEYYNGDYNFPIVYGHQGVDFYLDKSSIVVQESSSDAHKFACNVISVRDGNINSVTTYWFYTSSSEDIGVFHYKYNNNSWRATSLGNDAGYMQVVNNTFRKGWAAAFGYSYS